MAKNFVKCVGKDRYESDLGIIKIRDLTSSGHLDDLEVGETRYYQKPKPRKLQEIFDVIIDAGYFQWDALELGLSNTASPFMCHAIGIAMLHNTITLSEHAKARRAIKTYLKSHRVLINALRDVAKVKEAVTYKDCENVYRNWAKRPKLGE